MRSTQTVSLVLGCGYAGGFLVSALRAQGRAVYATSRRDEGLGRIEALGAVACRWRDGEPLPVAADEVFVLFPPRGGASVLLAAALSGGPRVVYCSSTGVYDMRAMPGGVVEDDSPTAPDTPWAEARLLTEQVLQAVGAVVVRAAGIYGPGRNMATRLMMGRLRAAGDLERPVNLIHVVDLATILVAASARGRPGEVVLAATGRPVSWRALAERAAALTGQTLPAPEALPRDPNLRSFYVGAKRCHPTKLERLGVQLKYPDSLTALREAWETPSGA